MIIAPIPTEFIAWFSEAFTYYQKKKKKQEKKKKMGNDSKQATTIYNWFKPNIRRIFLS